MSREEALFIGFAAALADTGAFATMSELHSVLRLRTPEAARNWLTDDVWHCLSSRIQLACAVKQRVTPWESRE
ncbi:hypothetical protein [Terricaulis sp.]|uniref:hypothetical protein n=1 Tax=Terricaulis sp. TaxID=2768686 RepID=UPI003782EC3A